MTHTPILESRCSTWSSEADCAAFAAALARKPALNDAFVALEGPLGAGKTTFVRYLLHALGVEGRIKSPTYTLLEPYEINGHSIAHVDFYRFKDPREWIDAGLRDVFAAPGLKLAEWPQNAAAVLPKADLQIRIELLDAQGRRVEVHAMTPRGVELLS